MDGTDKEQPSVLVIILDTNPIFWSERQAECAIQPSLLNFTQMIEHLIIYINSHLLLHAANNVAIISNHPTRTEFLFCGSGASDAQTEFRKQTHTLIEKLRAIGTDYSCESESSQFSASLSLALCYINRVKKVTASENLDCKILMLQGTQDTSDQYISMMNCIFSAQKMNVIVDACVLSTKNSTFLQQACYLTSGIYLCINPELQQGFLQYLLTIFLPDKNTRHLFAMPIRNQIDLRASCFCHRQPIEIGYVCSVCLSIYCKFHPVCSTCGTKFVLPKFSNKLH